MPLLKVHFDPVAEFTEFVHHPYVSLPLTLVTFFATHIEGIRYNGVVPYFRSWMPSGLPTVRPFSPLSPAKALLLGLIALIEVLSQLVRIVSLSFRLFFNLLAGH